MDEPAIYSGLTQIFREQLRKPALVITPAMTQNDLPGWDSAAMVAIIMAVEEQFNMEFTPNDLRNIRSIADLARLVQQPNKTNRGLIKNA